LTGFAAWEQDAKKGAGSMKTVTTIVGICGLWLAAPVSAQLVTAQQPPSLVSAMQAAGYAATLETDKVGDPMISSSHEGTKFQIFFYNCEAKKDCRTVQFHSGYDLKTNPTLSTINDWNRGQRFGRAYLDNEMDPILEMDVDLDDGGLSAPLFIDNLEFWTSVLGKFERHIGYRQ
jgi:hypothetical protein